MWNIIREDFRAVLRNDPAAHSALETLLFRASFHTIVLHRVAHWFHTRVRLPLLPQFLALLGRVWSGVEIHPAARIGKGFFIDHGTGVVIGETAEIGEICHSLLPARAGPVKSRPVVSIQSPLGKQGGRLLSRMRAKNPPPSPHFSAFRSSAIA